MMVEPPLVTVADLRTQLATRPEERADEASAKAPNNRWSAWA